MKLPKTRTSNILEMKADGELLIYDLRHNKAYNLNETSKIIYKACADQLSYDELKRVSNFTDDLIHFALDQLKNQNLLADESYVSPFEGLNRREVIRKVGLASIIALPVISVLIAPAAVNASSVCSIGNGTGRLGTGGSGSGQLCSCPTNTPVGTNCSYGTGSVGAPNTYCKFGCSCTSFSTSSTCTGGQAPCLGRCG